MSEIEFEKAMQKAMLLNTLASDSMLFPLDDEPWDQVVDQVDRAIDRFFGDVPKEGASFPESGNDVVRYLVGDKVDTSG